MKHLWMTMLFMCVFAACKPFGNTSETLGVEDAYRGVFQLSSDMFVPYSNIGYDKAFCAGTSTMHAMIVNRARFHDANPPSQKCPAKWTVQDDQAYEQAVWSVIQRESLVRNFTSRDTLHIFGAKNFNEFGTRGLHYFAQVVQQIQNETGWVHAWEDLNYQFVDFRAIGEQIRAGNMVLAFVYATQENPDESYSGSIENLRTDCESRGYVWDPVANECDWQRQMDSNHPLKVDCEKAGYTWDFSRGECDWSKPISQTPYPEGFSLWEKHLSLNEPFMNNSQIQPGQPRGNTIHPSQDRSKMTNHAVLVTGVYDDGSLQVYTTWDQSLVRWGKDLKVMGGHMGWMINPVIVRSIPIAKDEDRSQAIDLLKELNDKYAYTGPQAASGCPGTGGSPTLSRMENYRYDDFNHPGYNPYDPSSQIGYDQSDLSHNQQQGSQDYPFNFLAEVFQEHGSFKVRVSEINGCTEGQISWVISSTGYNQQVSSSMTGVMTYSSDARTRAITIPLSQGSNRWQVTGTCRNKRPYSIVVHGPNDNIGQR